MSCKQGLQLLREALNRMVNPLIHITGSEKEVLSLDKKEQRRGGD